MDGGRTRTPLSRARGLGSSKNGVEHWWMQRVTAVALVPLTLWFIASLMAIAGGDYGTVIAWFKRPLTTILMASLLTALFHHMALGLRVVVEDYVHTDRLKIPIVMTISFTCFALAVAGIYAILRIAFFA